MAIARKIISLIRWFGERLKDLFYATGNTNLELGRTVTGILTSLIVFSVWWNAVKLGQAIQLGELLTGLAAFITAAGLGIAAKDWVRNNAEKISKSVTTVIEKATTSSVETPPKGEE